MKKTILLTFGLAFTLISCSEKDKDTTDTSKQELKSDSAISKLLLKEEPKEAVGIAELRKTAKPGDTVTFTGAVIGSDSVFIKGRAIMVMGDPTKITSCDLHPGDNCQTPWDVCCDDPDVIKESILTVQVVDGSGRPLKADLTGVGGLKELSKATITGTVAKSSNESNMLINATGIYIQPKK